MRDEVLCVIQIQVNPSTVSQRPMQMATYKPVMLVSLKYNSSIIL